MTAEILADFLRDIDDPRRAVEIDDRVTADTGRTEPRTRATKNTKGYTGLEGLLNYAYYQAGAVNQFDQIGHLLHFSLYDIFTGPCGNFSSGRDPQTGEPGVPAEGGGTTTNILAGRQLRRLARPNQPGINEDLGLPPYDPSVCPHGHRSPRRPPTSCAARAARRRAGRSLPARRQGPGRRPARPSRHPTRPAAARAAQPAARRTPATPAATVAAAPSGPIPDDILDQILDLPPRALDNLPGEPRRQLGGGANQQQDGGGSAPAPAPGGAGATDDLLDFLFSS